MKLDFQAPAKPITQTTSRPSPHTASVRAAISPAVAPEKPRDNLRFQIAFAVSLALLIGVLFYGAFAPL